MRRVALTLLLLLLPTGCAQFAAATCGGPDDPGADEQIAVPERIAGLEVERDADATKQLNRETDPVETYQCEGSGRVYSMRKRDPKSKKSEEGELRAVLQISRLAPDARLDDIEFLRGLLKGPTGNIAQATEINCVDVYAATGAGNEQLVTMWFNERFMFFLTVREDPTYPGQVVGVDRMQLLREAVLLGPPGYQVPDLSACPEPSALPTAAPPTGEPTATLSPVASPSS